MHTPDTIRGEMAVFIQPQTWDQKKLRERPITELRFSSKSYVDGKLAEGEVTVLGKARCSSLLPHQDLASYSQC